MWRLMAFSRLWWMPGVSTKMIWFSPVVWMPSSACRVVCGFFAGDGDFLPDEVVDEGGFADVGTTNDGDVSGARVHGGSWGGDA